MNFTDFIDLVQTCGACPEQYDAFIGETQVGYLRLRHGYFYVNFLDHNGERIFSAHTIGDGIFDSSEREEMLNAAKNAIIDKIQENHVTKANNNKSDNDQIQ
jgi:hypothetical protein